MKLRKSLQSSKLWKRLNNLDANLGNVAIEVAERSAPQLKKIVDIFPLYTRHDAAHSLKIISRVPQIVTETAFEDESGFSASECLILITAAFCHDIGMSIFPWEDATDAAFSESGTDTKTFLRNRHAERGLDFLMHEYESLGLPKNLIMPIHHVMRAHNIAGHEILNDAAICGRHAAEGTELFLIDLLAIFCISDALEFSDDRVIASKMKLRRDIETILDPLERTSYLENQKHVSIGSSVAVNPSGIIIFSGTFDQSEVLGLTHRTIDDLEDWIRQYSDITHELPSSKLRNLTFPVSRQLSMPGVNFERLGIRIRTDYIIQLISSNSTWSGNPIAPIRELLQNAIEACRYRKHISPNSVNYSGRVEITVDRSARSVRIVDNGCGMTRDTILDHFLNVGHSRSSKLSYQENDFRPLAKFGVGFWSIFTIAEYAVVETCSCESQWHEKLGLSFQVSASKILDYTILNICELQPGTTITLPLKPDVDIDQLEATLKEVLISTEVPVSIKTDSYEFDFTEIPQPLTPEKFYGHKIARASKLGAETFSTTFSEANLEGAISIGFGLIDNRPHFQFSEYESITLLREHMHSCKLGVCGFPNNIQIQPILFDFNRVGSVLANSPNPRDFEFSLNRSQLIENDRLETIKWKLQHQIHFAFHKFLERYSDLSPAEVYRLTKESSSNGGRPAANYNPDGFLWLTENFPQLIVSEFYDPSDSSTTANYAILSNLREQFSDLVFLQNTSFYNREFIAERDSPLSFPLFRPVLDLLFHDRHCCICNCDALSQHLFDHTHDAEVVLPFPSETGLALLRVPLTTGIVKSNGNPPIENVSGRWSGTVFFRKILSSSNEQFVFLGQYRMIVRPDSLLASEFESLADQNRLTAIAEIANKLLISRDGSLVEDVEKFL